MNSEGRKVQKKEVEYDGSDGVELVGEGGWNPIGLEGEIGGDHEINKIKKSGKSRLN